MHWSKSFIKYEENISPTLRPIPYSSIKTVNKELDRLQDRGVISLVRLINEKKCPGKLLLCAYFSTELNDVLLDHKYLL